MKPDSATAADPSPPERSAPARALIEAQLVMLTRLAEIGMAIAEDAGRRSAALAQSGEAGAPKAQHEPDPGLTYSRAAHAVRLTFALQSRLLEALAALDKSDADARAGEARRRRERIHRQVKQAIEAECDDRGEIKQLSWAAWERLVEDDDGDFADLPISEVVARICADLGVAVEDFSLPLVGRVAAKPPGGAIEWNAGLEDVPHPPPFGGHPPHEGEGVRVPDSTPPPPNPPRTPRTQTARPAASG